MPWLQRLHNLSSLGIPTQRPSQFEIVYSTSSYFTNIVSMNSIQSQKIILQFELSFEFWIIFSSWRIVNIWKPLSYVIPTSPILKCTQGQHRPFLYTFYWNGLKLINDTSSRSYISSVSVSFNVIINNTKVLLPQAYVTLADLGYPV